MAVKVKDLIEYLKKQPQDLQVAYRLYSEAKLLDLDRIEIVKLQPARADDWIHDIWDDKNPKAVEYLLFPGN